MNMKPRAAIILAAGKGKRMNSDLAKVLHHVSGKSLIDNALSALIGLCVSKTVVVIGHQGEAVERSLAGKFGDLNIQFCWQRDQRGTGHAVQQTAAIFSDFSGSILVTAGDVPSISNKTLRTLFELHESKNASATCLSAEFADPTGYGRIVRKPGTDQLLQIIEHRDASPEVLKIQEINSGIFCFSAPDLFSALEEVRDDNSQGELYLTDVIAILNRRGKLCLVSLAEDPNEVRGVNSLEQLQELEELMKNGSS